MCHQLKKTIKTTLICHYWYFRWSTPLVCLISASAGSAAKERTRWNWELMWSSPLSSTSPPSCPTRHWTPRAPPITCMQWWWVQVICRKRHPVNPTMRRWCGKTTGRWSSEPFLSPEPCWESEHGSLHGAVPQHRHPDVALFWRLSGQRGAGRPDADA